MRYRGAEAALDHSSAYGQWGTLMIEFVQQHDDGPSAFHDMYPRADGEVLHHVALFVDNLPAEIRRFEGAGHACAMLAEMPSGFAFAMIDSVATRGHMIELYEPVPELTGFYHEVAALAGSGGKVLRSVSLG